MCVYLCVCLYTQALSGDVTTSEVHAYIKYLFARSDFLDMDGLVEALLTVGRYEYSQIQTLCKSHARLMTGCACARACRVVINWRRGDAAAMDMINCLFSAVEMMLTDAKEAMVLTAKSAVEVDDRITDDVCRPLIPHRTHRERERERERDP
jgi:hypothetical protein